MKAIERLGRIEYKAAFNRYLRRHAIRAFKQQFPNYRSYENAISNIDKAINKKAAEWKYNKVSVSINELDSPIDVMDNFMNNVITKDKTADAEKNWLADQLGIDISKDELRMRSTHQFYDKYRNEIEAWAKVEAGGDDEARRDLISQMVFGSQRKNFSNEVIKI